MEKKNTQIRKSGPGAKQTQSYRLQQKAFPSVLQPPGNSKHIHVLHELQDEGQWNSFFIFFYPDSC